MFNNNFGYAFQGLFLLLMLSCVDADVCTVTKAHACYRRTSADSRCGFLWWSRCNAYKPVMSTCYKMAEECCPNYAGSSCDTLLCDDKNSCQNGGTCVSVNNCTCLDGFEPPICNDINECNTENGGCSQYCTNTNGSYECSCYDDYVLDNDNKKCLPVCFGSTACQNGGTCVSVNNCTCPDGFAPPSCVDINECSVDNGGCSHHCTNTHGSFTCTCDEGYWLQGDTKTCPLLAVLLFMTYTRLRYKRRRNKDAFLTHSISSGYSRVLDRPLNVAETCSEDDYDAKTPLISFDKPSNCYKGNLLTDHYMDSGTQTEVGSETNRRTIFGKRFEHRFLVDQSRATIEMPDSDVRMTLHVKELISHLIEVFCSSFDNIAAIHKKMGVSKDLDLASPTVELSLRGDPTLLDVAVIVLPFVGLEETLKVRKFKSDEGIRQVPETIEVPKKGKQNEQLDLYYIVQDRHVFIYTRSFSGFYCTIDRHREIRLRAFLFGSYKRITPNDNSQPRMEVRIALYIADEILKFADYKKRLLEMEDIEGRILKKEIRLEAPVTSHDRPLMHDDVVEAFLISTDGNRTIELSAIVQTCPDCPYTHFPHEELEMPTGKEWYLRARPGTLPGFNYSGVVSIVLCSRSGGRAVNMVAIDELGLRQEDRYPVQAEIYVRSIHGIKEYLAGHSGEDVHTVLRHIGERYKIDSCSVPDTFAQLSVRLMPIAIIEAVVEALRATGQFAVIDALQKAGYIPGSLMYTPTQAVDTTNSEQMAACFVVPEWGPSMLERHEAFPASQYRCVSGRCENEARSEVETLLLLTAPVRESESCDTQPLKREINSSPVCSYIENENVPLIQTPEDSPQNCNTYDIVHGELQTSISAEITSEYHPLCLSTSAMEGHSRVLENTHRKELVIIAEETEPPESFRRSENDLSDNWN